MLAPSDVQQVSLKLVDCCIRLLEVARLSPFWQARDCPWPSWDLSCSGKMLFFLRRSSRKHRPFPSVSVVRWILWLFSPSHTLLRCRLGVTASSAANAWKLVQIAKISCIDFGATSSLARRSRANRSQIVRNFRDSIDARKTENARAGRRQVIQRLSNSIALHNAV